MLQGRRQKWLCLKIFFSLTMLGLSLPSTLGAATEPIRVRVSYAGLSGFQLPLWVLKEQGFDKKYGLDVQIVLVRGGTMSMQALLSGSTQFAQVAGDVTVGAALKGADIVTIAANLNRHVFFLVSQPAITTPDDLKGKRIGIVRFGGMNQWVATLELEALGLDSRDVVLLQAGNVAERLIAMERNLIDASVFSYPELVRLKKMGYRVLLDPGSLKSYFPTSTIAARREYLERNRDVAKNFLRSYTDAIYVIRTQRETAIKVMAKYTRLTDQEVLGQTYDFLARNMEPIPKVNLKGVESVLAELAKGEGIKKVVAKDLVESSLLDELERAGFFTRPR